MPKVLRDFLGLCFFFWSNEKSGQSLEPVHIHVSRGTPSQNSTKIWLKPDGNVEIAYNNGELSASELSSAMEYIKANYNAIVASWYQYFGSNP
jgi:hypothetical protein